MIPADGPDGIRIRFFVAGKAAGSGDLGKLVAPHDRPALEAATPLRQRAARDVGPHAGQRGGLTVVGVDQPPLAREQALAMVTRQVRATKLALHLLVAKQFGDGQRAHVDLVESLLHRGIIDLVGRIREMAGVARGPAVHLAVGNDAHVAVRVDCVRADEELLRFAVNEAVRRGAAYALGPHDLPQVRRDLVELVT
jgi:hypothetical protein